MQRTPRENTIEKIKSVIIVVLFLSAVLLLCFFWQNISVKDIRNFSIDGIVGDDVNGGYVPAIKELLVPSEIRVTDGSNGYKIFDEELSGCWSTENGEGLYGLLASAVSSGTFFAEEITAGQYETVTDALSLTVVFDYYLPFKDFCALIATESASVGDTIKSAEEISFSTLNKDSLFIKDGDNGKYYRILLSSEATYLSEKIEELNSADTTVYFPLNSYLGEEISSTAPTPLELTVNLKDMRVAKEFDVAQGSDIAESAEQFFSDSFDFVRKIEEESGRIVYMYGYGERILILDADGSLEYKCEATESKTQSSYFRNFKTAYSFIKAHGGFSVGDYYRLKPYIKAGENDFDGNGGSRFVFGIKSGQTKLLGDSGDALVVEVTNGQVTYFKKCFRTFDEAEGIGDTQTAMSAVNVLAQNYDAIYDKAEKYSLLKGGASSAHKRFNAVADMIDGIEYGYVYGEESIARPAWIFTCANEKLEIYFGLYDGEIIGYRVK